MLELCGLTDLGFEGYPFIWFNGLYEEENIQCHLLLLTTNFINISSPIKVFHLSRFGSDNTTVRVDLESLMEESCRKHIRLFMFEEVWLGDSRCEKLVRQL